MGDMRRVDVRKLTVVYPAVVVLVLLAGCYRSHGIEGGPVDASADAPVRIDAPGTDVGPDAPRLDAGPDAMVFVPPRTPRTERCDLARPPTYAGEAPVVCERRGGDADRDGFPDEVDCNDCSPQVNPGAYDFPDNGVDEDCDGRIDERACLETLTPTGPTGAETLLEGMGLCPALGSGPGVMASSLTLANGSGEPDPIQAAVLGELGSITPQRGSRMASLSNGVATETSRLGDRCFEGTMTTRSEIPSGVSIDAPRCPGITPDSIAVDSVSLEVTLRVPTNAAGFRIGSNFFTREYPAFICSPFNDVFVMLRQQEDGRWENLAFDDEGNPISVNNGLFEMCSPGTYGGRRFDCPRGVRSLLGTGFELNCDSFVGAARDQPGGATDWLCTDVATEAGQELTLRFIVWDSGDHVLSSLVLLDGFAWLPAEFESTP